MSEGPTPEAVPSFVPLPAGLEEMAPGAELGAMLATVDPSRCNGHQLVALVVAQYRQVAWQQAQLVAVLGELGHASAGPAEAVPVRRKRVNTRVFAEVGFALSLAAGTAERLTRIGVTLRDELPMVGQALAAGRIDWDKAAMLVRELSGLEAELAASVASAVLRRAESNSLGVLREHLRYEIMAVDPDAAQRRHTEAVARRHVRRTPHREGTASLGLVHLPIDRAGPAWDYVDRLAKTAKQVGGETRNLDQLRADVAADLLAGVDPTQAGWPTPAPRKGTLSITAEVGTLLDLNDHPGVVAEFGPVIAEMTRQLAEARYRNTPLRCVLSHDGRVVHEGRLHYKPTVAQAHYVRARDRRCVAPGCRRPAIACELDHITGRADKGTTHEDNLCSLCKRHHMAKTDEGYLLYRTDAGYVWVTPMGRVYPVTLGRELTDQQRHILQTIINSGETTFHRRQ